MTPTDTPRRPRKVRGGLPTIEAGPVLALGKARTAPTAVRKAAERIEQTLSVARETALAARGTDPDSEEAALAETARWAAWTATNDGLDVLSHHRSAGSWLDAQREQVTEAAADVAGAAAMFVDALARFDTEVGVLGQLVTGAGAPPVPVAYDRGRLDKLVGEAAEACKRNAAHVTGQVSAVGTGKKYLTARESASRRWAA